MNKYSLYFILLFLGSFGVALKFSSSHEKIPIGCDEFGYLNLSKAFTDGKACADHTNRPYLHNLLDTLRKLKITENEISYMVTPHAYHVIPGTQKIINQYPPGTSLLLTPFPISYRQIIFPFVVTFLLILMTIIALKLNTSSGFSIFDLLFPVLIFIIMVSAPFTTELSRINSLAPTFGLLFAAGIILNHRPYVSLFLLALTINFRIANLIMLLPIALFLPVKNLFRSQNIKNNLFVVLKSIGIVVLAILPILIYNTFITGNPFASTYSSIDQKMAPWGNIAQNLSYYFGIEQRWLRFHCITLLIGIVLTATQKLHYTQLLKYTSFMLVNYLFFIFHEVKMDYYPYASSLLLFGIISGELIQIKFSEKYNTIIRTSFIGIAILTFAVGIVRYSKKPHINFEDSKKSYETLCHYDIVWGDLYTGSSEYICNNSGFRYGPTTSRARKAAMFFLRDNNYSQVILLNDNTVDSLTIVSEIKETGLSYHIQPDLHLGNLLIIE
ncbi:MAG: hypothetical protein IPP71_03085 [Bacteroidetes bacterium]|nr:hypothetical protein [Bacteroidota bacterium]